MIKILILGGGFGGVRCALDLAAYNEPRLWREKKIGGDAEITLVDKKSYHLFTPALYEVASAYGLKQDPFAIRLKKTICIPYSDIFENKKIKFVQAEITSIDVENKKVATGGGEILDYDYLVVALGSQPSDFGVSGVKEYAFRFKNLEDGLALNQKIDELTKEVALGTITSPIKIAVIGAGFTGIEVAAELACCVKKFAKICHIKNRCERIILIEAAQKILPMISDEGRKVIVERLTRLGIEIMEGVAVEEVENKRIKLKNGKTTETDLTIWTAGVRPPDILKNLPSVSLTGNGKVTVNNKLEVAGLSNVFAVGDNVEFIDAETNKPVPALAYVAADQGRIAAKNILRTLKVKSLIPYDLFYSVWIAPIGGKYALAHLWGGVNIKGLPGWIIRELVDLKYMLSILPIFKAASIMWQEITLFTKND